MKCEEVRDEMIAYLKGELDEERRKEIEEHLVRCIGCQRELQMSQSILARAEAANEEPILHMAHTIIMEAIKANASDIHIDPTREGADVRYRIDGVLHTTMQIPTPVREAVVARFKLMSEMSVSERSIPQDGRFPCRLDDVEYDLRISVIPFVLGEKAVMRILSRAMPVIGLEKMAFLPEQRELLDMLIKQPCGLIVFSGPTGSGKTTTMYSILKEVTRPEVSVVTIEDPVECLFPGVEQAQVNRKAGLTFSSALRAFMRHDPDVIAVGDMMIDSETLETCAWAAISSHMVLGVFHADNAVSVPQGMVNFGMKPFLVGESLAAIMSQVLVRRICSECREEYRPSQEALEWLGLSEVADKITFIHGEGCDNCRGTGYRGRTSLHEILMVDHELRRMMSSGQVDPNVILRHAVSKGFITLLEVARKRVLDGTTDAEEVFRLAPLISSGPV